MNKVLESLTAVTLSGSVLVMLLLVIKPLLSCKLSKAFCYYI